MLARFMGLRELGQEEAADVELDRLYRALVPFDRELLELLDAHTLASMIGDTETVRALCQVMLIDGDNDAAQGAADCAARKWRRARELLDHAGDANTEQDQSLRAQLHARLGNAEEE